MHDDILVGCASVFNDSWDGYNLHVVTYWLGTYEYGDISIMYICMW